MKERTIPKTTSGKIQRRRTRALLHTGGLDVVQELTKHLPSTKSASEAVGLGPSTKPQGPANANEGSMSEPLTPEVKPGRKLVVFIGLAEQSYFHNRWSRRVGEAPVDMKDSFLVLRETFRVLAMFDHAVVQTMSTNSSSFCC